MIVKMGSVFRKWGFVGLLSALKDTLAKMVNAHSNSKTYALQSDAPPGTSANLVTASRTLKVNVLPSVFHVHTHDQTN